MKNKYLEDIPDGSSIYVDSNILIYHLLQDEIYGKSCKQFLKRVENKKITAFTSPNIITETLFIYLRSWIILNKKILPKKVLKYLKKNSEIISEIDFQKPEALFNITKILPVNESILKISYRIRDATNLLPNDTLTFAVIKHNKFSSIATCDDDFETIADLARVS